MGGGMGSLIASKSPGSGSFSMVPAEIMPLTDECHHYEGKHEVPWDIQRYFAQRYSIFAQYDEGIYLTDDAWFGVSPEPVANEIAKEMSGAPEEKTTLVDLFAGAGGNTIAFALSQRWQHIIAIERDAAVLACAQNNAAVYGLDESRITWLLGDSFHYLETLLQRPEELHPDLRVDRERTVLFGSPPWGGPGYRTDDIFDLDQMQPYNLTKLQGACRSMDYVLYLPRTSDIRQLARLAPEGRKIEVVQYCMRGASKALAAYIPADASTSVRA